MTKKELHKEINKRFYSYLNKKFPEYYIETGKGHGRIYLIPAPPYKGDNNGANSIEYHQSRHDLCTVSWCCDKSRTDEYEMGKELESIIQEVYSEYNESKK